MKKTKTKKQETETIKKFEDKNTEQKPQALVGKVKDFKIVEVKDKRNEK